MPRASHMGRFRGPAGLAPPEAAWYGLLDLGEDNDATTNRHYEVAHAGELDMVAANGGGWGAFVRQSQNAGSSFPAVLSSGLATPQLNIYVREASTSPANAYAYDVADASVTASNNNSGADTLVLDQVQLLVLQYDGAGWKLWRCQPGAAAAVIASSSTPDGDVELPANLFIGARSDLQTARYWQEEIGGVFAFARPLSQLEIETLALGWSPLDVLGEDCGGAWAFADGPQAVEPDLTANGNDAVRSGTAWPGAPGLALDAHSFTDVNTAADPWTTPQHTYDPAANLIIVRAGWENNQALSGVTADPGGADIDLAPIVASPGVSGQNRAAVWGVYSASPLGLSGLKSLTLDFAGGAAGSVGISSYIGATKLPTTFDADALSATSVANAIAIAGGEEDGHILSVASGNGTDTWTPGGGLSQQHLNQGADGGQTLAFAHIAGSLSDPEAPSYGKSGANNRMCLASVLVV